MDNAVQDPETPLATIDYGDFQTISDIKFRVVSIIGNLHDDELYTKERAIKDLKLLLVRVIEHEDKFTEVIIHEYEDSVKEEKAYEKD